ncbi:MAG: helix-turn-helix domain-containing protein [Mycobacteriaceae bacterium]
MGVRLSVAERELIARRWAVGVSSRQIARELGRPCRTVHGHVEWLRQRPPRARCRSVRQLWLGERVEIFRGLVLGLSIRQIAGRMGRPPRSSILGRGGPLPHPAYSCGSVDSDRGG